MSIDHKKKIEKNKEGNKRFKESNNLFNYSVHIEFKETSALSEPYATSYKFNDNRKRTKTHQIH